MANIVKVTNLYTSIIQSCVRVVISLSLIQWIPCRDSEVFRIFHHMKDAYQGIKPYLFSDIIWPTYSTKTFSPM